MKTTLFGLFMTLLTQNAAAQGLATPDTNQKFRVSLVFGLTQPIVTNGFNVEVNYFTDKFVFGYSHGFNLHFRDALVSDEARQQHVAFRVSHSLGFGIGYRVTPALNIRIEPKLHIWNVFYDSGNYAQSTFIKQYTTYTLGLGAYYRWLPFQRQESFVRGLTVVPSFRYWPNIGSSLKDNMFEYANSATNKVEVHRANNIGVNNTPFFANVSVGYTF